MLSIAAVVPCRNAAAFLGEALASIRAQTRPVDELIVVDDGSTDSSAAIAARAGATIIPTPAPGGPAAARNAGWRHARSEVIAFLDADDCWLPDHVATIAALLEAHPSAVLAFGGLELFGISDVRYPSPIPEGIPVDARVPAAAACFVPQMGVLVRRQALDVSGGYDESLRGPEDFELFARLARLGPFVRSSRVTARYRQHSAQISRDPGVALAVAALHVRRRNVDALRDDVSPADLASLEAASRHHYALNLADYWRNGERAGFDALLAAEASVPGAAPIAALWRRRAKFGWGAWMLARSVARTLRLRRLWEATIGPGVRRLRRADH